MTNSLQMAALFLAELGFGSAILMAFMPNQEIGKSYPRFYYGFITLLLSLFLFCLYRLGQFSSNYAILTGLCAWIWLLSLRQEWLKLEDYLTWVYGIFSAIILLVYASKNVISGTDTLATILNLTSVFTGALFLAAGLMAMIFGHWYLINRELPIKHLVRACQSLLAITYLRLACSLAVTLYAYQTLPADQFSRLTDFAGHGIFFWSRYLTGFLLPLLVAHLGYASAKIGSNQSATGILYAGTVFVLMGEMLTIYLFAITGNYF